MKHGDMGRWGWRVMALFAVAGAQAQGPSAEDYARAARLLPPEVNTLVDGLPEQVRWLDETHLVYRTREAGSVRFIKVNATDGKPQPAFNHERLARLLGTPGQPVDPAHLPITRLSFLPDGELDITGTLGRHRCRLSGQQRCVEWPEPATRPPGVTSPDGRFTVFLRDWNLWLRATGSGEETALTTDGLPDHGYATDNAGWRRSDAPIVVWSPDSTKLASFRQDQRQVGEMVLVEPRIGHPKVQRWKYSLPGDDDQHVPMIERVVIDVSTRTVTRLDMAPDQRRSTLCDDISCHGGWEDVQWAADSQSLAFVSVNRDSTDVHLRIADAATGAVRSVFSERTDTWFESGISKVSWRYLSASDEILWYSQRSDWGHLYLYDARSGALKRQLTQGAWNVAEVLHLDLEARRVWLIGVGREPGQNPYYRHLYVLALDGGTPALLLTPEDADHQVSLSADARWFVDRHSTATRAPVTVLRNGADGSRIAELGHADLTRLHAAGWIPPEPFTVKARDGETDLYGLLFKPSNFDPAHRYPVVLYLYPGPQTGSLRSHGFLAAHGDNQALAELGFIVVALDGMGTPWRSKSFHTRWAGDISDNTLPDQVTGLRQLADRHPWMDLERLGIWGHSGGGNAAAAAMFRYPGFFKVGVSQAGNHDNRIYADAWAEKWQGLETIDSEGRSNYQAQANPAHAHNLTGKLLLVHGGLDDNVPPWSTLLVVDALNRANKDYDLLWLPYSRHGYGDGQIARYVTRRRWDYFVRWLLGVEPPPGVDLMVPD